MRKRGERLVDKHLKLREDDWEFLAKHCGGGEVGMTPGEIIRAIVHQKVKWMRARLIQQIDELGPGEEEKNGGLARVLREGEESKAINQTADELGF